MPSIIPELYNYSEVGPVLLRLGLAILLLRFGYFSIFKGEKGQEKITGIIQILIAAFLVLGLFTQIAALLIILILLADAAVSKIKKIAVPDKMIKFIIFLIALSLVFLGPGLFSIDLPL